MFLKPKLFTLKYIDRGLREMDLEAGVNLREGEILYTQKVLRTLEGFLWFNS